MLYPSFISGSYQSQSSNVDQEHTVNFYVEAPEAPGATTRAVLYPTPGVTELSADSPGLGRAHLFMNGREFFVSGTDFREAFLDGTSVSRGPVALDSNPATISSNGDAGGQLFITSGGNGYVYTLATNVLAQVVFLTGKATMGGHLDGFFLALDAATSTLYISNLLNGAIWLSTQFARRSSAPDRWISMKVVGQYIWLLGGKTSEVWFNAGRSPFPFERHPSGLVQFGIVAPFSVVSMGSEIVWLGGTDKGGAQVLKASGFSPEVIASYPLQSTVTDYSAVVDAQGDSYLDRGHSFYLLTFPTQNVTWAWDAESRLWAERGTWISEENRYHAWRPRWIASAFGEHRILDSSTGALYRMSKNYATDVDDRPIRRLRRAPALVAENSRVFYSALELDLERGVGTVTGQGLDPQVMMRTSNDGGRTWGSERSRSAGRMGQYGIRVRWDRCGAARRRVFEVSVSDPVPWALTGAYLTLGQPVEARPQQQATA